MLDFLYIINTIFTDLLNCMIIEFITKELEEIYTKWVSVKYGIHIIYAYIKKVSIIKNALDERDIRAIKGLHLEKLTNYPWGMYSIKINTQWRLIFDIKETLWLKMVIIKEISNHYKK